MSDQWRVAVWSALACAIALAASPAVFGATPAEEIVAHYRAYRAAYDRNDLATAERELVAAFDTSRASYGDGGRTAVLALNLADLRLTQNKASDALEPARLALALAEKGGTASGVDARMARLTLARAEVHTGDESALKRLDQAVEAAVAAPELIDEVYESAVDLAAQAMMARHYSLSADAWATVENILRREAGGGSPVAIARAQVGQATAGIMSVATHEDPAENWSRMQRPSVRKFEDYEALLVQVIESLTPEASRAGPTDAPTAAQTVYAQAVAWRGVLHAKMHSDLRDWTPAEPSRHVGEIGGSRYSEPPCNVSLVAKPAPRFPSAALVSNGVGFVVLKFRFDDAGAVQHWAVAASAGGPAFLKSISDVAGQWRIAKDDPKESGCRLAREIFTNIQYRY